MGVLDLAFEKQGYISFDKRRKTNVQSDQTTNLEIKHDRWSERFIQVQPGHLITSKIIVN